MSKLRGAIGSLRVKAIGLRRRLLRLLRLLGYWAATFVSSVGCRYLDYLHVDVPVDLLFHNWRKDLRRQPVCHDKSKVTVGCFPQRDIEQRHRGQMSDTPSDLQHQPEHLTCLKGP